MIKKIIFLLTAITLVLTQNGYSTTPANTPQNANAAAMRCFGLAGEPAFTSGEQLNYTVRYSAAIVRTAVADAKIHTTFEHFEGRPAYRVKATGKTKDFYSLFFNLEDTYTTWLDTLNLRPLCAKGDLKEGGYLYTSDFRFNWNTNKVYTIGHNVKNKNTYRKTMPLNPCSYDAIGLFFNMRQIDTKALKPNQAFDLSLVLEDTIRNVKLRYLGTDKYSIENVGDFRTLKFACQFATSTDESFKDGDEFYVWITDDKNKIPVYVESPIRIGKISVSLDSWAGLMHPMSSLIFDVKRPRK